MNKWSLKEIKGIVPALLTPFDEDETISEGKLRNLVNYLISHGISGFYLTGSTGEGFLMTAEERELVVEIVMDEVKGRVPVVVHVGAIATKTAVELSKHAYKNGAAAVSSVPPFYYKFSFEEISEYYQAISDATPLPVIIYSISATTGVDLGADSIKKLARIENVKGIKYTSMNHYEMQRIRERLGDDFLICSGADEMCVSGFLMGATSAIGSSYNFMPEVFVKITRDLEQGDFESAVKRQVIANDLIEIFGRYGYYASVKQAMKWLGADCGYNRRPFKRLKADEIQNLRKDLLELQKTKDIHGVRILEVL
jgi:N-acetylneuraminate lyase